MCGIAGIIHGGQLKDTAELAKHFITGLQRRGPDFKHSVTGDDYLLVHTRLSVIDLDARANQPFESSDGRYLIVLNGEIYNYKELKTELEKEGHVFKTQSDTEVLLTGFIAWGEKVLGRLDGMFAFAIWDCTGKKLFMARDRVGKKPLFYCTGHNFFCFASESDVIAASGLIKHEISPEGVNSFLAIGYVLSPGSLYKNIFQLNAGSYLWLDARSFTVTQKRYWGILPFYQNKINITRAEATENIRALLQRAVSKRLAADVEIGVFLSGGIDSSVVAALAAKQQPKLKTFTAAFGNPVFDESAFAAIVSSHIGAVHLTCKIEPVTGAAMQRIIAQTDGVLADTSLLAMNPLAKFTRQYVKAVLSGDGADELFGGYATYRAHHWRKYLEYLPAAAWRALRKAGGFLPAQYGGKVSLAYKWDKFFGSGKMDSIQAHYYFREHHPAEERIAIMGSEYAELVYDTAPLARFRKYDAEAEGLDGFEKLLYVDFKTWLADDILVKTDRSSMCHGLETRSPFLDKQLLEFVASLPAEYKSRGANGKTLLRGAFSGLLPPAIVNRKKSGFNVPLATNQSGYLSEYKYLNDLIYKQKING